MSLQSYLANSWIRRHDTSPEEIANLLAIADRDIGQSQTPGLGSEWRFDIAYNAALQCAVAALAAAGFRTERQNKHMRTIECLEFTIECESKDVHFLDQCRRKRHTAVYEVIGAISDREADEMVEFAKRLRGAVAAWLERHHAELI
jgi:hypothetical protein